MENESKSIAQLKAQAKTMPQIENDLAQFTGTENYYAGWCGVKYTDGVQYFAGIYAGWLITDICSYRADPKAKAEPFQVWKITVNADKSAVLTMTDGNSDEPKITQEYGFADLPAGEITFYLIDGVMLLPSEY